MPMRRFFSTFSVILALAVSGCDRPGDQLTADEARYVERFIALEHARAVALADPDLGDALLDSLAAAWGDSAEAEAMRWFPSDPQRAEMLHSLLQERLEAESDSLARAPISR